MNPDQPLLICVDDDDVIVGHEGKDRCHDGDGILHRAFSIYLFDDRGRLLIQRRSLMKRLWPGFWSNSCCSHPHQGEETHAAAERRLVEELGISSSLTFGFKYRYQADFDGRGAENELCSVFVGTCPTEIEVDPGEVLNWQLAEPARLEEWLRTSPQTLTPWFRLALGRVISELSPGRS